MNLNPDLQNLRNKIPCKLFKETFKPLGIQIHSSKKLHK